MRDLQGVAMPVRHNKVSSVPPFIGNLLDTTAAKIVSSLKTFSHQCHCRHSQWINWYSLIALMRRFLTPVKQDLRHNRKMFAVHFCTKPLVWRTMRTAHKIERKRCVFLKIVPFQGPTYWQNLCCACCSPFSDQNTDQQLIFALRAGYSWEFRGLIILWLCLFSVTIIVAAFWFQVLVWLGIFWLFYASFRQIQTNPAQYPADLWSEPAGNPHLYLVGWSRRLWLPKAWRQEACHFPLEALVPSGNSLLSVSLFGKINDGPNSLTGMLVSQNWILGNIFCGGKQFFWSKCRTIEAKLMIRFCDSVIAGIFRTAWPFCWWAFPLLVKAKVPQVEHWSNFRSETQVHFLCVPKCSVSGSVGQEKQAGLA